MIITNVGHEMKWKWGLKDCSIKHLESIKKKKLAKRISVWVMEGEVTNKSELEFKCVLDMKMHCLKVVCHGVQALPSHSSISSTMIFRVWIQEYLEHLFLKPSAAFWVHWVLEKPTDGKWRTQMWDHGGGGQGFRTFTTQRLYFLVQVKNLRYFYPRESFVL